MSNIPSKPVINIQPWINGHTRLNQTNLTHGVNQNITNLKTTVDGIVDALGGAGSEPASDKTLNQTIINDYSASTTYTEGQVVEYDNKYYRCKVASSQGVAPTNTTNWAQIGLSTPVDSALDEDSTNPVQNGVVTVKINSLDTRVERKVDKSGSTMTGPLSFQAVYHIYSIQASGSDSLLISRDSHNKLSIFKDVVIVYDDLRINTMGTNAKSATTKQYVDDMFTRITGYDATKTQVLKNINGTLTWVDE